VAAPDQQRIPHTRGDEPVLVVLARQKPIVFPTRVGMNRYHREGDLHVNRIPHTRGDEPWADATLDEKDVYSPHAWG